MTEQLTQKPTGRFWGFCRQKLFLPARFFPWKKRLFPPGGKNLPTLTSSYMSLHYAEREREQKGMVMGGNGNRRNENDSMGMNGNVTNHSWSSLPHS